MLYARIFLQIHSTGCFPFRRLDCDGNGASTTGSDCLQNKWQSHPSAKVAFLLAGLSRVRRGSPGLYCRIGRGRTKKISSSLANN